MFTAFFLGNLADNAREYNSNGAEFCSFRAASNRNVKDQTTGQVKTYTTWVSVIMRNNYKNLMPYLVKGTKVFVEGSISTSIYQGRDGISRVDITINANRVELAGAPVQANSTQPQDRAGQASQTGGANPPVIASEMGETSSNNGESALPF